MAETTSAYEKHHTQYQRWPRHRQGVAPFHFLYRHIQVLGCLAWRNFAWQNPDRHFEMDFMSRTHFISIVRHIGDCHIRIFNGFFVSPPREEIKACRKRSDRNFHVVIGRRDLPSYRHSMHSLVTAESFSLKSVSTPPLIVRNLHKRK